MASEWTPWIDYLTTKLFKERAICGKTPGQESVWASDPGLANISAEEIRKLADSDRSSLRHHGVYICGVKYIVLRDMLDDDQVFTMDLKTAPDAEGEPYNVCVGQSKMALVIGLGKEDSQGGPMNKEVFKLVEKLREVNY